MYPSNLDFRVDNDPLALPQEKPTHLKVFGFHVPFTADDDAADTYEPYPKESIMKSLSLNFTGVSISGFEFVNQILRPKVDMVNQTEYGDGSQNPQRSGNLGKVNIGTFEYERYLEGVQLFKFAVGVYGFGWT